MKADEVTFGVREFKAAELTVTVHISKPLRFRIWLAKQLLRVAGWLACHRIVFDEQEAA